MVLKKKNSLGCLRRWMGMLILLPMWSAAQQPLYTAATANADTEKLETEPVVLVAEENDKINAAFYVEGRSFYFRLSGTGTSAHTINTDDPLIFLLENDSTVTLRATAVQGFDDLDSARTYQHVYGLQQGDLEMLGRSPVQAVRKYTVIGFDDYILDRVAAAGLHTLSTRFLQQLDREGLLKKVVLTEPSFPGGSSVLLSFLNNNLKPLPALPAREQKTAIVQFRVDEEGRAEEMQVKQSAGMAFDAELLRILNRMPRWKAGLADGNPVKRDVTLQLRFLQVGDKVRVFMQ